MGTPHEVEFCATIILHDGIGNGGNGRQSIAEQECSKTVLRIERKIRTKRKGTASRSCSTRETTRDADISRHTRQTNGCRVRKGLRESFIKARFCIFLRRTIDACFTVPDTTRQSFYIWIFEGYFCPLARRISKKPKSVISPTTVI